MIDRDILEHLKAANIRLRFDKVALRVVGRLEAALADDVPDGEAVIVTLTAPIRQPAKTAAVLEGLVRDRTPRMERDEEVHGNQVKIRWLADVPRHRPKVLGFVHDPAADADRILGLARAWLHE